MSSRKKPRYLFQQMKLKLLISILIVSGVVFIIGFAAFTLVEAQLAEVLTPPDPAEVLTPPEPIINDSNDIKTSKYSLISQWGSRSKSDIQFSHPGDIAVDSLNFVYVVDGYNVQKYHHNGTFITGWGSESWGNGITVDASGNVYVADWANDRIQKFDSNGTFITTWGSEGTEDGQLDHPGDVAVDSSDYVYVAGSFNDRIQKFDSNLTFITEWGSKGDGDGQFNHSTGKRESIAIDSSDYVYVADTGNDRIQKFDSNGTFITKWGSDTPEGIGVDSLGNVYVGYQCPVGPCHIQKFDNNGEFIMNWKQGNPNGQFDWPGGIAIDSSDYVYVADTGNDRIQKFDKNGTFVTKWGSESSRIGEGQFFTPSDIAVDHSGNLYVADSDNDRIQKFDNNGTFITKWGSGGDEDGQFDHPYGIAIDSSNYVYVADPGNDRIQKFDNNGTFITNWGFEGSKIQGSEVEQLLIPQNVDVDHSGNLYVADSDNDRIQKFDNNGTFITEWGSEGNEDGQFDSPADVAVDRSGNVFVADTEDYSLQQLDNGAFDLPDSGNDRIQKFDNNGTFITKWGTKGDEDGRFNYPAHIAVDRSGNLYVADSNNDRIQKFDNNGTFIAKWGSYGRGNGQFLRHPDNIAVDLFDNVYVTECDSGCYVEDARIQKFDNNGTFIAKWGSSGDGDGEFDYPTDIAVDHSGNLYVADTGNDRIQKFDNNGTFITKWGSSGDGDGEFGSLDDIAFDRSGNLYVADTGNDRIQKFDSNGAFITKWGSDAPEGIGVDSLGYVYVSDSIKYIKIFGPSSSDRE